MADAHTKRRRLVSIDDTAPPSSASTTGGLWDSVRRFWGSDKSFSEPSSAQEHDEDLTHSGIRFRVAANKDTEKRLALLKRVYTVNGFLELPRTWPPKHLDPLIISKARKGLLWGPLASGKITSSTHWRNPSSSEKPDLHLNQTYNFVPLPLGKEDSEEDYRDRVFYIAVRKDEIPSFYFRVPEMEPDPLAAGRQAQQEFWDSLPQYIEPYENSHSGRSPSLTSDDPTSPAYEGKSDAMARLIVGLGQVGVSSKGKTDHQTSRQLGPQPGDQEWDVVEAHWEAELSTKPLSSVLKEYSETQPEKFTELTRGKAVPLARYASGEDDWASTFNKITGLSTPTVAFKLTMQHFNRPVQALDGNERLVSADTLKNFHPIQYRPDVVPLRQLRMEAQSKRQRIGFLNEYVDRSDETIERAIPFNPCDPDQITMDEQDAGPAKEKVLVGQVPERAKRKRVAANTFVYQTRNRITIKVPSSESESDTMTDQDELSPSFPTGRFSRSPGSRAPIGGSQGGGGIGGQGIGARTGTSAESPIRTSNLFESRQVNDPSEHTASLSHNSKCHASL